MSADRYSRYVADTLRRRIPVILRNTEDGLDAGAVERLRSLARAIAADVPIEMESGDVPYIGWEELPGRVNGRRPSEAAFFDFEFWMYLRILGAVRFRETGTDPFRVTKHRGLDGHLDWAATALDAEPTLEAALNLSLDANAHDLSQLSQASRTHDFGRQLLAIAPEAICRLNLIADNFGAEFAGDLVLAIVAAEQGIETVIHLKQVPMFVSDATLDDVDLLLGKVGGTALGRRLLPLVDRGRIRFAAHPFWSSPQFLDRLPVDELAASVPTLNVLKGDLNFRRAVGDVSVPVGTPFADLAIHPAAPMLSLRSIKSYCAVSMSSWPEGMSRDDFPTDGTIVVVQEVPAA